MRLRVVTYNVRSLRDDRDAVIRTLRDLDADVVCLQEVPRFLRWRSKCAALARESGLLYVAGGRTAGAVAVLASLRVDAADAIEYRMSRTPGLFKRGCVSARIRTGGGTFVVASFHLGLNADERVRHRTELVGLVDRYAEPVTILGGDVNEMPGEPTWDALAAEFSDGAMLAGDANSAAAPTFPAKRPKRRIDGIFVRGPATVSSYAVVDTPDVTIASDHRPVVAEVDLAT